MQNQSIKSLLGPFSYQGRVGSDEPDNRMIYPLHPMLFARLNPQSGAPEALQGQFGLLPPWVDDAKGGPKFGRFCYNARSESIFEKPSFRDAILTQRALIPVTAFYEFPDHEKPLRHRYKVFRRDQAPFWFAGLWAHSPRYNVTSCSIVTVGPMAVLEEFHSRSPLILDQAQAEAWLDPQKKEAPALRPFFKPAPSQDLVAEAEDWGQQDNTLQLFPGWEEGS